MPRVLVHEELARVQREVVWRKPLGRAQVSVVALWVGCVVPRSWMDTPRACRRDGRSEGGKVNGLAGPALGSGWAHAGDPSSLDAIVDVEGWQAGWKERGLADVGL